MAASIAQRHGSRRPVATGVTTALQAVRTSDYAARLETTVAGTRNLDLLGWLQLHGLARLEPVLRQAGVDLDILPDLGEADLEKIGLNLGDRKRLLKAIGTPSSPARPPDQGPPEQRAAAERSTAERRQLTVMFCDLVGSTELSRRLDPEVLQQVLTAYHRATVQAVGAYGGHVAQLLGDGVLVYFGYPAAHEDDAERAVRAGLSVLRAVARLPALAQAQLQTRIGIATGLVVVGEIGSGTPAADRSASGSTPNLAARLQACARPGEIVISSETRRLVGGAFELAPLEELHIKGFDAPVQAWQVVDERVVASRFEAQHARKLGAFIGRDGEIAPMLQRWSAARGGEGQVVLVSGEAGIGKSRIADAFRDHLRDQGHVRVLYQCSPHHVNTPFYPVVQQIRLAAGIGTDDSTDRQFDKLGRFLGDAGVPAADVPFLAELLAPTTGTRYAAQNVSPQEVKQRTLRTLLSMFQRLAHGSPVLFVLEDAHWLDPTTSELIDLMVEHVARLPALMVVTHRPEFQAHWRGMEHCTTITLGRLGRRACGALIADLTEGTTLPDEVEEQILAKTDGIPLFVEELTKTVLESGLLTRRAGRYETDGRLPALAIPSTLHDSLMARLDRLGNAKEVTQIGAAIGREFPQVLLEAVDVARGDDLERSLERLVASEILYRRGIPPDTRYVFKHALIQDAAYEGLLHSRRQQIHAGIAEALRVRFPDRVANEPEVLAHHYDHAGQAEKAAPWWLAAGRHAVARSGNAEAIAHLRRGIDALAGLPGGRAKTDLELDMQISMGSAQIAARGYSADETAEAYVRGRELVDELGDDPRQFAILHGLCMVYWNRAQLAKMLEASEDMLARAERQGETLPRLVAHRVMAVALNAIGRFAQACVHAERAIALYDPQQHRDSAHSFGHDMGVGAYWHLAIARLFLGQRAEADEAAARASTIATESGNANTRMYDALYKCFTGVAKGEWAQAHEVATIMIHEASTRSMSLWEAFGRHHLGCVLAVTGEPATALAELHRARDDAQTLRNAIFTPMTLGFEALALARMGRADDASELLDQAIHMAEETGERWWEPELHRQRGAIARQRNMATSAEASFQSAIEIAQRQGSWLFGARAASDLADSWRAQGRLEDARQLLARIQSGLRAAREAVNEPLSATELHASGRTPGPR